MRNRSTSNGPTTGALAGSRGRRAAVLAAAVALPALAITSVAPASAAPTPLPSPSVITPTPSVTPTATVTPPVAPAPSATASATSTPTPTAMPTPTPTSSPKPTVTPTPTPTPTVKPTLTPPKLTLAITAGGTPVAGKFFQDVGYYNIKGTVVPAVTGKKVYIWWYSTARKKWVNPGTALTTASGAYSYRLTVGHSPLDVTFRTTLGPTPKTGVLMSNEVKVHLINSILRLNTPPASVDSLKSPAVSGSVYPARAGVRVHLDVVAGGKWTYTKTMVTTADGKYSGTFSYGVGNLATYKVRTSYISPSPGQGEATSSVQIKRAAVLNATIRATTAADVADTYHSWCPVGKASLRTIDMNFYGFDGKMHRGQMIVKSTMTAKVTKAFGAAISVRYPIKKMNNPNVYDGNDPKMMAADNTSAFNCRKVTGNPYATSPHSYGTAIDVNTVENPYRDINGRWWPSANSPYIDRSPLRKGMLGENSTLTNSLQGSGYFWGGQWSPDRDYQHFQY